MTTVKLNGNHPTTELVGPEMMTKRDLADYLQCSLRQVEILTKKKRLPKPLYLGTAMPRWRRSELMAFLEMLAANASAANQNTNARKE